MKSINNNRLEYSGILKPSCNPLYFRFSIRNVGLSLPSSGRFEMQGGERSRSDVGSDALADFLRRSIRGVSIVASPQREMSAVQEPLLGTAREDETSDLQYLLQRIFFSFSCLDSNKDERYNIGVEDVYNSAKDVAESLLKDRSTLSQSSFVNLFDGMSRAFHSFEKSTQRAIYEVMLSLDLDSMRQEWLKTVAQDYKRGIFNETNVPTLLCRVGEERNPPNLRKKVDLSEQAIAKELAEFWLPGLLLVWAHDIVVSRQVAEMLVLGSKDECSPIAFFKGLAVEINALQADQKNRRVVEQLQQICKELFPDISKEIAASEDPLGVFTVLTEIDKLIPHGGDAEESILLQLAAYRENLVSLIREQAQKERNPAEFFERLTQQIDEIKTHEQDSNLVHQLREIRRDLSGAIRHQALESSDSTASLICIRKLIELLHLPHAREDLFLVGLFEGIIEVLLQGIDKQTKEASNRFASVNALLHQIDLLEKHPGNERVVERLKSIMDVLLETIYDEAIQEGKLTSTFKRLTNEVKLLSEIPNKDSICKIDAIRERLLRDTYGNLLEKEKDPEKVRSDLKDKIVDYRESDDLSAIGMLERIERTMIVPRICIRIAEQLLGGLRGDDKPDLLSSWELLRKSGHRFQQRLLMHKVISEEVQFNEELHTYGMIKLWLSQYEGMEVFGGLLKNVPFPYLVELAVAPIPVGIQVDSLKLKQLGDKIDQEILRRYKTEEWVGVGQKIAEEAFEQSVGLIKERVEDFVNGLDPEKSREEQAAEFDGLRKDVRKNVRQLARYQVIQSPDHKENFASRNEIFTRVGDRLMWRALSLCRDDVYNKMLSCMPKEWIVRLKEIMFCPLECEREITGASHLVELLNAQKV